MRMALAAFLICQIAAQAACAGAWMRDPDTGFTSVTTTIRQSDGALDYETSLYGDYGLTPRLTVGVDVNERAGLTGHALGFVRIPLGHTTGRTKIALELAGGASHWQGQWAGMIKSTLSVGRGFSSRWGDGWFSVDTAVELRRAAPDPVYKLDATLGLSSLGLSSGGWFRPIIQLETAHIRGKPLIWALTPGLMIDGPNTTTWLIGLERRSAGQSSLGLKIGLWRRF